MAQSISNIAVIVNGETVQLQSAMQQAAKSMDTVSRASKRLNADMMEQRRVMRAMNPAITSQDKAYDSIVENARRTSMLFSDVKHKTDALTVSTKRLADAHAESAQRMKLIVGGRAASGLGALANTASAASGIDDLTARMSRFQGAAQQGVFALDDFVAGFSTGGVAGGLRGAANNISMMAMMLGTLKIQLIAIGAIAVSQIALSFWNRRKQKELEDAEKAAKKFREELERLRDLQLSIAGNFRKIAEIREVTDASQLGSMRKSEQLDVLQLNAERSELQRLLADRTGELNNMVSISTLRELTVEEQKRLEVLQDEVATVRQLLSDNSRRYQQSRELLDVMEQQAKALEMPSQLKIIHELEEMNRVMAQTQREMKNLARQGLDELDKRLQSILNPKEFAIQEILRQVEEDIKRVNEAAATGVIDESEAMRRLQAIGDAAAKQMREMNPADMSAFGRLPSALTMGSPGAVSSINQSIAGSMNLRDSTRALRAQENTEKNTARIREMMEKGRENILAVVPL